MLAFAHIGIALTLILGATPLPAALHGPRTGPALGHAPAVTGEPAHTAFGPAGASVPDTFPTRWVLQADATEARYRVREQLAGFDFPNDAVGSTRALAGTLALRGDGTIIAEESSFRVALATLVTDNDRRDNYVRNRTLEVELHPEVVFTPRRFADLPTPLPASGSANFRLEGDLTIRGVTRPTVWEVMAQFGPTAITGLATTAFPFERFEISIPRVARVLSVENNIRLELQFRLVPQGE